MFRQAEKAGVKKFVYVSTILTFPLAFVFGKLGVANKSIYDRKSRRCVCASPIDSPMHVCLEWAQVSKENIINNSKASNGEIYIAEKTLAELAVWEFADKHPHIDVTSSEFFRSMSCIQRKPTQSLAQQSIHLTFTDLSPQPSKRHSRAQQSLMPR